MPVLPETRRLDDYGDHDPEIDWHASLAEVDQGLQDMTLAVASMQAKLARLIGSLPPRDQKPAEIIDIAGYGAPQPTTVRSQVPAAAEEPAPPTTPTATSTFNWSGAEPPAWQPKAASPTSSVPDATPLPTLPRWLNDPLPVPPHPVVDSPIARGFSTSSDSTNPGSWPTGGFKKAAEPAAPESQPPAETASVEASEREAIAAPVTPEEAPALEFSLPESTEGELVHQPEVEDEGTVTVEDDVATPYDGQFEQAEPEELDIHEQVRRAVEEARAEIERNGSLAAHENTRAEPGPSIISDSIDDEGDGEIDVHEQVRRAVEEARAELEGSKSANGSVASSLMDFHSDASRTVESPDLDEWMANANPPTLVIENPSSRVELSRVYELLAHLDSANNANLMNYLPHSVTITIGGNHLPDESALRKATEAAFGCPCHILIEGNRASVRLMVKDWGKA